MILASSHYGFPLSTTHVASGSIIGSGVGKRLAAVRWGVAGRLALAWLVTLPAAGAGRWRHRLGGRGSDRRHGRRARDGGGRGDPRRRRSTPRRGSDRVTADNVIEPRLRSPSATRHELARLAAALRGAAMSSYIDTSALWHVALFGALFGAGIVRLLRPRHGRRVAPRGCPRSAAERASRRRPCSPRSRSPSSPRRSPSGCTSCSTSRSASAATAAPLRRRAPRSTSSGTISRAEAAERDRLARRDRDQARSDRRDREADRPGRAEDAVDGDVRRLRAIGPGRGRAGTSPSAATVKTGPPMTSTPSGPSRAARRRARRERPRSRGPSRGRPRPAPTRSTRRPPGGPDDGAEQRAARVRAAAISAVDAPRCPRSSGTSRSIVPKASVSISAIASAARASGCRRPAASDARTRAPACIGDARGSGRR